MAEKGEASLLDFSGDGDFFGDLVEFFAGDDFRVPDVEYYSE